MLAILHALGMLVADLFKSRCRVDRLVFAELCHRAPEVLNAPKIVQPDVAAVMYRRHG